MTLCTDNMALLIQEKDLLFKAFAKNTESLRKKIVQINLQTKQSVNGIMLE